MIKGLVAAGLGILGFYLPLVAQETDPFEATVALDRSIVFSAAESTSLPALTLLDQRRFLGSSALGRMGMMPADLFPLALLQVKEPGKRNVSQIYRNNSSPGMSNFLRLDPSYSSGEIGAYYGRSGGKYGSEVMGSYIVGTVGNDKFQITAGASYEDWSGRVPRRDVYPRLR
jgi:hypothetical protein